MSASGSATLQLLKRALVDLDERGPTICAAYVSHAIAMLEEDIERQEPPRRS